jgi:hypothetical protein
MKFTAAIVAAAALITGTTASDFAKLDQALPSGIDISSITPLFDIDTDSCLFSAGISRTGAQNGGLKPSGSLTGSCRNSNFLSLSNLYHRYACITSGSTKYCGHFFAVYALKDQIVDGVESGHRHDWEKVIVWTENGVATYGTYSAHSGVGTAAASAIPQQNGHLKFVYHKDGVLTHAMRFAKTDESAENPSGSWFTPTIVSWYTMVGDGVTNAQLRADLNSYDYGSANFPQTDSIFLGKLNEFKPSTFPTFTQASVDSSQ